MSSSDFEHLKESCYKRLDILDNAGKLWDDKSVYVSRLEYELSVFDNSGYAGVLNIIKDYITWARSNGIVVGPGRGSAAGSLVVYLSEITTIDPIRFKLIFERFLNPDRVSLPDIDTDFSDRDAVIKYLKSKYGKNRIARVGVPSLFKPKSAIDEIARGMGISFEEAKLINKIVGNYKTFNELYEEQGNAIKPWVVKYEDLFRWAERLQGYVRLVTSHPSAVILTQDPIGASIPMQRPHGKGEPGELITAWDGEELDSLKYVKLDILTVDNLSIIDKTVKMIPEDKRPDIYNLPLDDKKVLSKFSKGETVGIFQMEEPWTVEILKSIDDICFDDLVAVNALIRPGLDIKGFIRNRNNPKGINYIIPQLEPILKTTYGVLLYQEQVMRMCVDLAGFSMAEADKVRKIIAKTANQASKDGLKPVRDKFMQGYLNKGYPEDCFDEIWASIEATEHYSFCKSHSVAYATTSYVDQYLKTYYPLFFMCSALQTKSREIFVSECERLGIKVLPPDINLSDTNYKIEGESIRVGLSNIKNIGKNNKIFKGRPYTDVYQFISAIKPGFKILESLVYAGALDSIWDGDRKSLISAVLHEELTDGIIASKEKEYIGFYVTINPLKIHEKALATCVTPNTKFPKKGKVGGLVIRVHEHRAKTGMMAFVDLLTKDGEMSVLIWPSDYLDNIKNVKEGNIIKANGDLTERGSYSINNVKVLDEGL